MSNALVTFESVWKKFQRGERHDSLRDVVPAVARRLFGRSKPGQLAGNEFWALQDVSFRVEPGQALGIIGTNGAGKSTALKLLTKILRPNKGSSAVRGRIGALIEVAAGFHPDLTGRENIFLQGTIMGMKQADIARKLDDIVDFAGVSEFIDTPVKRYSSGMHARLGFSIASHLDPEVLIIDEVLAVGDMAFQRRCEDRMLQFVREGVAIVFVSHNLEAVSKLCTSALLLERGTVRASGAPAAVLATYASTARRGARAADFGRSLVIERTELVCPPTVQTTNVTPGDRLTLLVGVFARAAVGEMIYSFAVRRSTDQLLAYQIAVPGKEFGLSHIAEGERVNVEFTFSVHLARGQYHLECAIDHPTKRELECEVSPAAFMTVREEHTQRGVADLDGAVRLAARPTPVQVDG